MRWFFTFAWLLFSAAAFGQSIEGGGGLVVTPPIFVPQSTSYSGPGDVVSGAKAWWGLRAYNTALANAGASTTKAIDVLGSTTVTACTIFLAGTGSGDLDLTTAGAGGVGNQCLLGATTFCSATNTSCTVSKLYDQTAANSCSSASCDLLQVTAAQQPEITFNCIGTKSCLVSTGSPDNMPTANTISQAQPFTYSAVAERTANFTSYSNVMGGDSTATQFLWNNTANNFALFAGTLTPISGVNDSVFHALQGVFNGASAVLNSDGTETTVNSGSGGLSGDHLVLFADAVATNTLTGRIAEAGLWGLGFSGTQRTNECRNEQAYYGAGNFGAAC